MEISMISGVQIIGILFSLSMLYLTFVHRKRRAFGRSETLGWMVMWLCFIVALLFPNTFSIFTQRLGFARAFDLFSIVGFVIILSLSFHNYVSLARLKKKLEASVRKEALADVGRE